MGLVYEAEHLRLGRRAALKLLTPDMAADSNVRERFVQESRLIAAIDHPNIIPIYDAGESGDTLYIAMRLVAGGDLAKLIGREGKLGAERTLALIEQAAAALDAAHARGMVHRDVKPANVLLEDPASGRAFLTDFGVAKLTGGGRETKAGMFIGSVDYASPEQIEGGEIAPPVDVYALGCVLFECLTGRRPYRKNTNVAILFGHLRDPPPRVTEHVADLPTAIDRVVATALAKDPARSASAPAGSSPPRRASRSSARSRRCSEPRRHVTTQPGRPERPPLPEPEVELVGRETEARQPCGRLLADPDVRLVTLTGPGGTGKTRLALAVAAASARDFPGGAILVELETLTDAGLVLAAVAEQLGSGDADVESLARQLARRAHAARARQLRARAAGGAADRRAGRGRAGGEGARDEPRAAPRARRARAPGAPARARPRRWSSSSSGRAPPGPDSSPRARTPAQFRRSARASTASRSRSSWLRHASVCSRRRRCSAGSIAVSRC